MSRVSKLEQARLGSNAARAGAWVVLLAAGLLTGGGHEGTVRLAPQSACAAGEPCYNEHWDQPLPPPPMKLDITFFIDTSKSLNPERNAVADKIDALVGAFPKDLDYRMGVILSHGYDSPWAARYYKKGNEPRVLNSKTMTVSQIRSYLKTKFTDPDWHRPSAGEVGMHALYLAVNDAPGYQFLTKNRADGMFRKDAGQVFIFISDENDICATYPTGVTPVSDVPDNIEKGAYKKYCAPGGTLPILNEEYVWKYTLRQLGAQTPMLFSAIVHTKDVPLNPADPLSQDEYGYGYMELVRLAKGTAVDIDEPDYRPGLKTLGGLAAGMVTLKKDFVLSHPPVDTGSIVVKVDGQVTTGWTFDAATNVVTVVNPGQAGSTIDIYYCERPKDPPSFLSLSPVSGSESGGTIVTIKGNFFQQGVTAVFGGVNCGGVQWVSKSEFKCTTSAHVPGKVDVVITNPDTQTVTAPLAFEYLRDPPKVLSITPNWGFVAGGDVVTISGSNFDPSATAYFDGVACTSVVVSGTTQIGCVTPPHAPGVVSVSLKNADGQTAVLLNAFTYKYPPPAVMTITPVKGSVNGGTFVTITGQNFLPGALVGVGGNCTGVSVAMDGKSLTCTTTAHAAGKVDVTVTNTDTQSATLAQAFEFVYDPPTFLSLTPQAGTQSGGTVVTIRGTAFRTGVTAVFGGVACTGVALVNATEFQCTTGAHAPGFVDVVVTNSDGQSATGMNAYQYLKDPPKILSIAPTEGPTTGGQIVAITGTNFDNGAKVTLGGTPCTTVTFISSTQLGCMTAPHAAGLVSVTVTNLDNKSDTLVNSYRYMAPPPSIIVIAPNVGTVAGGTKVMISGSEFQPGATVDLGGSSCSGVVVNGAGDSLSCTTTAHPASVVDVKVLNPDGQSATLPRGFTYQEEDCSPGGC